VTMRPSTPSRTALRTDASTVDLPSLAPIGALIGAPIGATTCGRRVVTATSTVI
jgi:hypothetical protein